MTDALIISSLFLGLTTMFAVPLVIFTVGRLGRAWLKLKERELELRQIQVASQLRQAHFRQLPDYVDAADPEALLAWARADRELQLLAGSEIGSTPGH